MRRSTIHDPRSTVLALYQGFGYVLLAVMALIGAGNLLVLGRRRRNPVALPEPAPRISVLVPARNEAGRIAACVESLVAQDYPAGSYEILVLDDRSTDGTGAVLADLAARHPALRTLAGAALPDGWGGKAHACQQLADAARGDWLLFVDADTTHGPGTVRGAVAAAVARGVGALTILPRERADTFGERLLVPHLFFFLLALQPLFLLEGPRFGRFVFANGQFLLVRREVYRRVGGHAAIRAQLMEDLALGLECKRAGERLVILDGGDWTDCRMFDGFAAAWAGFVRSLQAGQRLAPPYLLGIGSLTILFFAGPFVVLLALLLGGARGRPLLLAAGQATALLAIRAIVGRGLRQSAVEVALFPLGAVVLSAASVATVWRWLRGQPIRWRGREYGDLGRGARVEGRRPEGRKSKDARCRSTGCRSG